jgi:hypothetical protein
MVGLSDIKARRQYWDMSNPRWSPKHTCLKVTKGNALVYTELSRGLTDNFKNYVLTWIADPRIVDKRTALSVAKEYTFDNKNQQSPVRAVLSGDFESKGLTQVVFAWVEQKLRGRGVGRKLYTILYRKSNRGLFSTPISEMSRSAFLLWLSLYENNPKMRISMGTRFKAYDPLIKSLSKLATCTPSPTSKHDVLIPRESLSISADSAWLSDSVDLFRKQGVRLTFVWLK